MPKRHDPIVHLTEGEAVVLCMKHMMKFTRMQIASFLEVTDIRVDQLNRSATKKIKDAVFVTLETKQEDVEREARLAELDELARRSCLVE